MTEEQKSLQWLGSILDTLRKECPWDSVQTIDSLRYLTIEEVYELSEAITAGNYDEMRKELGDLFMHLMFYAKIADDEGRFNLCDVLDGICRKLIARHPHIALPDREGTLQPARQKETPKWEQVKMKEGRRSAMEGVPASLPSLVKAVRLQEKAAGLGFEFPNKGLAKAKVNEEYREFVEALDKYHSDGEPAHSDAEEELGDLLFAIVKWARFENINADDALAHTNLKFAERFKYVETKAEASGRKMQDLSLEEMERYWNEAKTELRKI
jgi:XTP/dITP diphosphohydrolase